MRVDMLPAGTRYSEAGPRGRIGRAEPSSAARQALPPDLAARVARGMPFELAELAMRAVVAGPPSGPPKYDPSRPKSEYLAACRARLEAARRRLEAQGVVLETPQERRERRFEEREADAWHDMAKHRDRVARAEAAGIGGWGRG